MLRSFHLNVLQNKMWPTDRNGRAFRAVELSTSPSSFRSWRIHFRPFSASFVTLELFSDCLRYTTLSSKTEEGPAFFKLPEAAMFV